MQATKRERIAPFRPSIIGMSLFKAFLDGSYQPNGCRPLWYPGLISTHVVAALLIVAVNSSIPLALISSSAATRTSSSAAPPRNLPCSPRAAG